MKKYTVWFKLLDHEQVQAMECDSTSEAYNLLLYYAKSLVWWELYDNEYKLTEDSEAVQFRIASRKYS